MDNTVRDALNYKVVVLGDKNVGKTSLVCRYIEDTFRENNTATIGAFYLQKKELLPDKKKAIYAKMQVWDTAGQERYRAIASLYYRNADAAIVCYDFSDEQSFIQMKDWINELKQNLEDDTYVLIIASTKIDKGEQHRGITLSRCQQYASSVGAFFFETSAKTSIGVSDLFATVVKEVYAMRCRNGITPEVPAIRDSEIVQLTAGSPNTDPGKKSSSSSCSSSCS